MDDVEDIDVAVKLARIETKLEQLIEINRTRGEDHENRIRQLEKWKYALPVSALGAILSAVIAFNAATGR